MMQTRTQLELCLDVRACLWMKLGAIWNESTCRTIFGRDNLSELNLIKAKWHLHIHVLCDDDDGAPPRKPDDRSMLTEQEEDETNCVLSSGQDTNQLTTTPAKWKEGIRNHFWATFIDIWRFFSGHNGKGSEAPFLETSLLIKYQFY